MENFKHIVRLVNADLDGNKPIYMALTKIKGVGRMFSNMVCSVSKIDKKTKAGVLTDEQLRKLEDIILNPLKYNVPEWLVNRNNDPEEGVSKHIVSGTLQFVRDTDIRNMQKIKSNRGLRHAAGLPLRGQRTKSNFRRNKGKAVGVKKKKGAKSGRV